LIEVSKELIYNLEECLYKRKAEAKQKEEI